MFQTVTDTKLFVTDPNPSIRIPELRIPDLGFIPGTMKKKVVTT
jgi:hypothetical protein